MYLTGFLISLPNRVVVGGGVEGVGATASTTPPAFLPALRLPEGLLLATRVGVLLFVKRGRELPAKVVGSRVPVVLVV